MEIRPKIKTVLSGILKITEVPDDISQNNCDDWDSLRHLFLIAELESEFNISIEPEEIAEMKTLCDIERVMLCKLQNY